VLCELSARPNSRRLALGVGAGLNSRKRSRQYDAPTAVRTALPPCDVPRSLGIRLAYAGVIRVPAGGNDESGADDRRVM